MLARLTITTSRFSTQLRTTLSRVQTHLAEQREVRRERRLLAELRNSIPPQLHQDIGLSDVRRTSDIESLSQRLRR
ncbi:hypothetical protein [Salinibius halmophilus]|uniref:hypothetical protein n=1 Tax=Salinibius halmophilus TaxID=1853216 RepID=UPI000E6706F3|nr:hypothetical protein [Salinibius halmophilus]